MYGYHEVEWKQANCNQQPLNLFYVFEEHKGRINEFFSVDIVKRLCFACPIWRNCLEYAIRNEDYGIWGGLTTRERDALIAGEPSTVFLSVTQQLMDNGISISEILEIIREHSRYERSMANQPTD